MTIPVKVLDILFRFNTFDDWVNHAPLKFRAYGHTSETTLCVDNNRVICSRGKHFQEAAYPIDVYAIDDPPYEPGGMIGKRKPVEEPRP